MSAQTLPLETIFRQLIDEHRKLLALLERQQEAMKKLDMLALDQIQNQSEACRLRIVGLEAKRRMVVQQIAKLARIPGEPKVEQLVRFDPKHGAILITLRDELKALMLQISNRSKVASRLAGAVLGHMNTVVRLISGAVEQAGLYTKAGVPRVSNRIGVMEAVG